MINIELDKALNRLIVDAFQFAKEPKLTALRLRLNALSRINNQPDILVTTQPVQASYMIFCQLSIKQADWQAMPRRYAEKEQAVKIRDILNEETSRTGNLYKVVQITEVE